MIKYFGRELSREKKNPHQNIEGDFVLFFHEYQSFKWKFFSTDPNRWNLKIIFSFKKSSSFFHHIFTDLKFESSHNSEFFENIIDTIYCVYILRICHSYDFLDTSSSDLKITRFEFFYGTSFRIVCFL